MAGNKDGNMFGVKPVVGSKQDNVSGNTIVALLKKLVNKLGLGAFSYGFDGGFDVYSDETKQEILDLENHFHGKERWRGLNGAPTDTVWLDDVLTPFQAISGNNTWGTDANDEAKIVGSDDTPILTGAIKFDVDRLLIDAVSTSTVWKLRIIWGIESMELAIANEQYSEAMFLFDSANPQLSAGIPVPVKIPSLDSGTKVWVQAWNATNNATISFHIALHEYFI